MGPIAISALWSAAYGGGDRTGGLYSRENATPSSRPILRITYTVSVLTLSSAANQFFTVDGLTKGISPITVTDDGTTPAITAANDIRIRIPSSFNMTWDTSNTSGLHQWNGLGGRCPPPSVTRTAARTGD